jgi:hypothetical protein
MLIGFRTGDGRWAARGGRGVCPGVSWDRSAIILVMALAHLAPGLAAAQDLPRLGYRSTLVVTSAEFGSPSAMHVGPDGNLYAAYPNDGAITVFEARREAVQRVHRALGEGPGFPRGIGWVRGVFYGIDRAQTKVVFFDHAWQSPRRMSITVPGRVGNLQTLSVFRIVEGDRMLVRTTPVSATYSIQEGEFARNRLPPELRPETPVQNLPFWLVSPQGEIQSTLVSLPVRNEVTAVFWGAEEGGRNGFQLWEQPFSNRNRLGADAAGNHWVLVEADNVGGTTQGVYQVHRISLAGDTIRTSTIGYSPVALAREAAEQAVETLAARFPPGPLSAGERTRRAREALYIPAWLPPLSDVRVDLAGWVWVARERVPGARYHRWDILDPSDHPVGYVEIPERLSIRAVNGLEAWAIERDAPQGFHLWRIRILAP